jgi:hypothetical protein
MATDFLLDEFGDLLENDAHEMVEGVADEQHIVDCLITEPGSLKHDPLAGVGITKSINGNVSGETRKEIRLQLLRDSFEIIQLDATNENISIDAYRTS